MSDLMSKDEYIIAFRKLYGFIYKTAIYIIKDKDLAFDICQETFIRGYNKIDTLNDTVKFRPWILKIATNTSYEYIKRNKEIYVEDINGIIQFEDKFCRQANNNVEQEVLNHELEDEIKKILVSLNPRYSAILIYRFYCEMTYEEIAEELGIDINSVKVNLHRGKKQFKKQLQVNNTLKEYIRGVGMDGK
jgi:RNA polymerase sigma-70 factor (ECF subfamily)